MVYEINDDTEIYNILSKIDINLLIMEINFLAKKPRVDL